MIPVKNQPETPRQVFLRQFRRFRLLWFEDMKKNGPLGNKLASPKNVLSFAEDLILCPTEEAVKVLLQRDREAARGVYITAGDVNTEVGKGHVQVLIPVGPHETPFGLLGAVVRAQAQAAIEKYGGNWPGLIVVSRED